VVGATGLAELFVGLSFTGLVYSTTAGLRLGAGYSAELSSS
jgi:hypothetical protein